MYNSLIYHNPCNCRTSYTWATFHHHQRGIQTEPAQAMWPMWSDRWEMTDITPTELNYFWSKLISSTCKLFKSSSLVIENSTIKKTVKIQRYWTVHVILVINIRTLWLYNKKKNCFERYMFKHLCLLDLKSMYFCCLKVMRWKSAWVYPRKCVERYVGLQQGGFLLA